MFLSQSQLVAPPNRPTPESDPTCNRGNSLQGAYRTLMNPHIGMHGPYSSLAFERASLAVPSMPSALSSVPLLHTLPLAGRRCSHPVVALDAPTSSPFSTVVAASVAHSERATSRSNAVAHDARYYAKCMAGGALACGITHCAMTPLDVTKCNMQVNPSKYGSLGSAMGRVVQEEGFRGVWKGWLPTLIGYSMQGLFKFGLYEYFKDHYSSMAGSENAQNYRGLIYCAASASAEFFADMALCPMEMVKVKVQTSPPGTWPVAFRPALAKMKANRVETRFPFGSVVPLWSRQIPYTVAKFYFFEKTVSFFYTHIFTKPKDTYSKAQQLGVTFLSGYTAGIVSALVSQPSDNVVSQIGKAENKGKSIRAIAREVGLVNLLTRGLTTRIIMVGTITGFQWWIYDTFKTAAGLETSGGK